MLLLRHDVAHVDVTALVVDPHAHEHQQFVTLLWSTPLTAHGARDQCGAVHAIACGSQARISIGGVAVCQQNLARGFFLPMGDDEPSKQHNKPGYRECSRAAHASRRGARAWRLSAKNLRPHSR
jgi:hypothetical protein